MQIRDVKFLEAFDGGSHRSFREGLIARSGHRYSCHTLPDRFWKWRMRSSAVWFADQLNAAAANPGELIFATGMLNVASLRGLLSPAFNNVPTLLYMHENQLTYPLGPREKFDFLFGFTNIVSAMAADRVVFNSEWHRDAFFAAVPKFLKQMPEAAPERVVERLQPKCEVLGVGLDRVPLSLGTVETKAIALETVPDTVPLILWNHRWEFDKCPEVFAEAIKRLLSKGLTFRVALLGESNGRESVFQDLRGELGDRCVAFGHQSSRVEYDRYLAEADIVVSCAKQENFGISIAEAIHAGCHAVLPKDQVYPSFYGPHCSGRHFYNDFDDLVGLLENLLTQNSLEKNCSLANVVDPYCWPRLAPKYDKLIEDVIAFGRNPLPAP
ncbi:MAG: glycosyltransferase involved in cell wall biosynthesis [Candidatus Krumholzibacteriia bacterium]